jgi:hypothetical protein
VLTPQGGCGDQTRGDKAKGNELHARKACVEGGTPDVVGNGG